jgi:hypothetical protein
MMKPAIYIRLAGVKPQEKRTKVVVVTATAVMALVVLVLLAEDKT